MRRLTGLLVMLAAFAIALPALAQSTGSAAGTTQGATAATASAGSATGAAQTAAQPNQDQAQVPQPAQGGVNWQGVGIGAGTVVGNLFYVPAKIVYGVLGGVTGGASYLLTGGNTQTANTIWRSSLGGDYVLTPGMVAGQQPIHFSGPTATAPLPANQPVTPGVSGSTASGAASNVTTTASASNPTSVTSATVGGSSASTSGAASTGASGGSASANPQPADSGTGPVGTGGVSAPPLPSTRIE